ncbi:MAG: tryptophan 7-halogenase [Gammaproteobacteria bacterium]|nr:tryptophan 7-halogenase [Gammaproteobacteria bacterium]
MIKNRVKNKADVTIMGGGLAGLGLARQLKRSTPELDVLIVERNKFPVPDTTAKVGESTVELASHYLVDTLGLKKHFEQSHLRKHGLRCFFGTPSNDYSEQDELGVSELFGIPTYQLDRGVLENHLHDELINLGVNIVEGATTKEVSLGKQNHCIKVATDEGEKNFSSRWLVDAAGRQKLISNKLNLTKTVGHKGNAVWFRIDRRVVLDTWSEEAQWQNRLQDKGTRWLSTNHLTGPGYWVWVIPLGTGTTSIGIVMDDQALEQSGITSLDEALRWLDTHQPRCAEAISGAKVLDFCLIRDYAYGCKKMFSDDGWCLTGEAGAFSDPFYSPGSDFIAINNTFIDHLIACEKSGQDIRRDSALFHVFYNSFFDNTLSLYSHQYGGFGDRRMMGVKLLWDYSYYWGVLTLLFYKNAMTDAELILDLNPLLKQASSLNATVQEKLRDRAKKRLVLPAQGVFLDQYKIPCLRHFNNVLKASESIDIKTALVENVAILKRVAAYSIDILADNASANVADDERDLFGDYRQSLLA